MLYIPFMENSSQIMIQCSMSEETIFDLEGFLARIGGDMEIAEAVVDGFLLDIPSRYRMLQQALSSMDATLVRQHAHAIHGASVNIGAKRLAEQIRSVEDYARSGEIMQVIPLIPELERRMVELEQVIRDWRMA